MQFKNNTKRGNVTIQGLRSFKDTLPKNVKKIINKKGHIYSETLDNWSCLLYTSPSPRDLSTSRMPSSA